MSNNIYNILNKLKALTPQEPTPAKQEKKQVYESVEARGSVLEGVGKVERQLTEKFAGFDVSESGLQAYLGKKKYGEQGMKALQKAGREGASKEKMAMIRAKHDKMDEAVGQEGPADLLAAVEQEIARPGRSTDNLRDVLNATFGSDRSPEFKKARAVIGKYLDLVDNADVGSEQDGIAPMRGGNIARYIQQYDLTDYLQHAAAMLDKHGKMDEAVGQEGPADLLAAVEQEIARPGRSTDNLRDVLNATFGSDRSPEFKKARAVIGKYIDLVDNAAMGSEQDGIAPMRGGNIARHIQQYDLTDYLQHAAAMLDNAVKGPMHDKMDESNPTDPNTWQGPDAGGAFPGQKVWPKGKRPGMYNTQTGKVSHWDNRTDTEREKSWDSMIEAEKPHPQELEMDAKVRSMQIQQRADKAEKKLAAKRAEPKNIFQKVKKDLGEPLKKLAKGDIKGSLSEEPNEEMLSTKDKKFASLAEPKDKITYADKIAGAKKKTEGNKFTGNLMKARAQGKKEADLDGDGDMEKVREGWDDMMKAAKERSGPQPSGGSGIKAGKRYGGAAQKDDEGDKEEATADAPKKKGRPKKDKFAESELNEFNLGGIAKKVAGVAKGVTQGIGKAAKAINSPIGNANVRPNDNWLARYGRRVSDGQGFVKHYVDHRTGQVVYTPRPGTERMNESDVFEKAPPGAKAERMVKHIKKGYAKDGKVTPKEKGIAYATAWKAHNKGKLAESVIYEGGDPQLDHILNRFKNEVKRFQAGDELDDDLYMALYDYYMDQGEIPYGVAKARDGDPYQWVEDRLASYIGIEEGNVISLEAPKGPANPALGRDALSPAEKLAPHAGVGKGPIGKAIGSAVTTAKNVGRFIQGKPEIPTLEDRELNELARLAGLSEAKKCNSTMEGKSCPVHGLKECGSMNEAKPDFLDLDKDGNKKESMKKASKEKVDECGPGTMSPMSNMGQDEGSLSINTSMNSDGTKSVSVNATGNQADALAQMLKMAGIGGSYSAKTSDETVEEERDIEYANTPEEEMETVDAIMHQGNDLNREKEQYADRPRAGDNPMATPTRESVEMPKKISRMLEGIKKVQGK